MYTFMYTLKFQFSFYCASYVFIIAGVLILMLHFPQSKKNKEQGRIKPIPGNTKDVHNFAIISEIVFNRLLFSYVFWDYRNETVLWIGLMKQRKQLDISVIKLLKSPATFS